jgi:fumarate reductase flavoprotein subunit
MIKLMAQRAVELGAEIYLETPVEKVLKENGVITGVIARDSKGEEIRVNTNAVIIATGGFGDNPDWIKKYIGYEWGKDMMSTRIPGLAGDGIRMAWEVGAGRSNFDMEKGTRAMFPMGFEYFEASSIFAQPNLMVNMSGERFFNEGIVENSAVAANAVDRQQNRNAFMIVSDSVIKHYRKYGADFASGVHGGVSHAENFSELMQKAAAEAPQNIFIADSVEELAEKMGIDPETLKNTVDTYNQCCEKNYDDYFCKNHRYLKALKGPKFYAARIGLGAYCSLGGIKTNYKTEVLTEDFKKIPGLYAAGTDICDIYAGTYLYVLPGNTMGFALNTGRIAAENAIEYLNSLG